MRIFQQIFLRCFKKFLKNRWVQPQTPKRYYYSSLWKLILKIGPRTQILKILILFWNFSLKSPSLTHKIGLVTEFLNFFFFLRYFSIFYDFLCIRGCLPRTPCESSVQANTLTPAPKNFLATPLKANTNLQILQTFLILLQTLSFFPLLSSLFLNVRALRSSKVGLKPFWWFFMLNWNQEKLNCIFQSSDQHWIVIKENHGFNHLFPISDMGLTSFLGFQPLELKK